MGEMIKKWHKQILKLLKNDYNRIGILQFDLVFHVMMTWHAIW
jgi:hypothetical protein